MIKYHSGISTSLTKKERKGFPPLETPLSKRKKENSN